MARSSWDGRSEQDKDAAFELLDQKSTLGSIDNDWTPSTSRLPPKNLPLRTKSQVVRTLFWTGAIAVGLIAGISVLASDLFYFLPYTDSLQIKGGVSCDLRTGQAGTLQDAFTLNLRASTHLSFTEAKAIDVIWQLFVGAGGRFWLAWISYKVFMDGLARLTEKSPISYNLYASLTFSTTTLWTTYFALKGVFFAKGWRCKFFLLWFGISTLYVLGFPTLMSATAGYVIPSTSGFQMSDGVFLTPDSESLTSCFEVHDGALIGLTNETIAQGPPVSQYNAMYPNTSDISKPFDSLGIPSFNKSYPLFASLLNCKIAPNLFNRCWSI